MIEKVYYDESRESIEQHSDHPIMKFIIIARHVSVSGYYRWVVCPHVNANELLVYAAVRLSMRSVGR